MKKMMFSAIAAAVLAAPALAGAQSPSPSPAPSPQTPPPSTPPSATAPAQAGESRAARADKATGELVKVDAVAKKLTIKGTDGVETDYAYSDATEVAGGQDGVAGLATKAGTKVTVHFKSDMGTKTATKIEVADKAAPRP
jgi:hypothetical protein